MKKANMRKATLGRIETKIAKQGLKKLSALLHDLRVKNNTLRNKFDKNDPFEGGKIAGYKPKINFNDAKTLFLNQLERYKKLQLSDDAMVDRLIDCYNIIADRWLNSDEHPDEVTIIMELAFDWYFNFYWKTPARQAKFLTAWRRYMQVGRPTPLMMKFANATVDGELDKEGLLNGLGWLSYGALDPDTLEVVCYVRGLLYLDYITAATDAILSNEKVKVCIYKNEGINIKVDPTADENWIREFLRNQEYKYVCSKIMSKERRGYGQANNSIIFDEILYFYTFVDSNITLDRYVYI